MPEDSDPQSRAAKVLYEKATGDVNGVSWLEAWGISLIVAMEAMQALEVRGVMQHEHEESRHTDGPPTAEERG